MLILSNQRSVKHRLYVILVLLCCFRLSTVAQVSGVVAAMDTRLPLRDVAVRVSDSYSVSTDWRGRYRIDRKADGATFTCKGYMIRTLTAEEMRRDTVFLMPLLTTLDGVEVVAPRPDLKGASYLSKEEMRAIGRRSSGSVSFDFFSMFDRSKRRLSRKERARQKQVLDNY